MANSKKKSGSKGGNRDLTKASSYKASGSKQKSPERKRQGLREYLKGVRQELKKVVWPEKSELRSDTIVVIATCVFFAVAFWLIDTGFLAVLKGILGITLS